MSSKAHFSFDASVRSDLLKALVLPPVKLTARQDAIFYWREDGVTVGVVDGSSVIQVEQRADSDSFDSYTLDAPHGVVSLGVPCKEIHDFLSALNPDSDELVHIEYESQTNSLDVRVGDSEYNLAGKVRDGLRTYEEPDIDYQNRFFAHKRVFKKAHDVVGMVDDEITFCFGDGQARISSTGDTDKLTVEPQCTSTGQTDDVPDSGEDIFFVEDTGEQESEYSKQVLGSVLQFLPNDYMEVRFSEGQPMKIESERFDGNLYTKATIAKRVSPKS